MILFEIIFNQIIFNLTKVYSTLTMANIHCFYSFLIELLSRNTERSFGVLKLDLQGDLFISEHFKLI